MYFPASKEIKPIPTPLITFTMILLAEIITVYSPSISAMTLIVEFSGYTVFSPDTIILFMALLTVIVRLSLADL